MAAKSGLDTRQGRHVRAAVCRACGAPVLRGLDNDRCALLAEADPYPLSSLGEALALLGARATYRLRGHPPDLYARDPWQIRGTPADLVMVVAEHRCGADLREYHRPVPAPPTTNSGHSHSLIPPF